MRPTRHATDTPACGRRPVRLHPHAVLTIASCLAAGLASGQVTVLPDPVPGDTTSGSLAGDGSRLVAVTCVTGTSLPGQSDAVVKEWDGSAWVDLETFPDYDCWAPSAAVKGTFTELAWIDDDGDLVYFENVSAYPAWMSWGRLALTRHHGKSTAFGLGLPYVAWTRTDLDGLEKVWVDCGPEGPTCSGAEGVYGGYRSFGWGGPNSVGSVSLAGDDAALYVAFDSPFAPLTNGGTGCVNVLKLTRPTLPDWWLGPCFAVGSEAGAPDVAVVSGQPVVAWREYAGRYLRVARWNGSSWTVIRSLDARPETFAFAVVEGSGSTLFLARQSGPSIVVESWNGTSWSAWPDPVAAFPGKTVSVLDLAVLDGEPYLMLMVGGDVRVARLSAGVTTCSSFSLSSTLALPNAAAGSTTVTVTGSPTGCQGGGWTASGNGSWITVSPASGTGSGAVTVSWSANLSADSRSGVATVAAKSFSVLQAGAPHSCTADATTLCLLGNRFRVTSTYRDYGGGTGTGKAVPLTTDTGYFWYFTSANVEVVAKMVSFCSGGTHNVGVYANGLTDLGVTITVTDTVTGLTVNYANPLGTGFRLIRDGPFSCSQGASAPAPEATVVVAGPGPSPEPGAGWVLRSVAAVEPSAGCTPDTTSLCLLNDRFRVTSTYRDYGGGTGSGKAVRLTSDTGYFWFFEPANVEVVAKMVSFCSSSTHNVGVYANGLTDLAVTLTVTDTQMGLVRSYSNALGRPFELIRDGPFACP